MGNKAVVVGGGIGGLAAAIGLRLIGRLAPSGVTVRTILRHADRTPPALR